MKKDQIQIDAELPLSPDQIYTDWLDSKAHAKFTGGEAEISGEVGASFTTWDGYISGKILELEKGKRILQTWRTTEFNDEDEDSILEILFEANASGGTKLVLKHSNIPEGDGEKYRHGWYEFYVGPIQDYYMKGKS